MKALLRPNAHGTNERQHYERHPTSGRNVKATSGHGERIKLKHETMDERYYDKITKARRCRLDDASCIEYVITALGDEDRVRPLWAQMFSSTDERLWSLEKLEDRLHCAKPSSVVNVGPKGPCSANATAVI